MLYSGEMRRMDAWLHSITLLAQNWGTEILLTVNGLLLIGCVLMFRRRLPPDAFDALNQRLQTVDMQQQQLGENLRFELSQNRSEGAAIARSAREEQRIALRDAADSLLQRISENAGLQRDQLDSFAKQLAAMTHLHDEKYEALRNSVDERLRELRLENSRKLDQMRAVVDEKLQSTLERRLGESFRQVSERLEQVYRGLGEMRSLADGVGDLKKVLTNVKTRGTWGEIRLAAILEQILTPEQYDTNVAVKKNSTERVEFAVRLPGRSEDPARIVWLPIDSKFPQEDYQRLADAREAADKASAQKSLKNLEARIKAEARFIRDKYIDPPRTTDFAILFLPVEGLYAEVLGRPGLCDMLQREFRVMVAGPTTLAALLNSLQMGFRTLAIEKRSSEVWRLLGAVKTEFGRFGEVLAKTRKKLQEASHTIDQAEVRTRVIARKLRRVQEDSEAASPSLEYDQKEGS
jgi:DNA recombination protein RmuC